MLVRSRVIAALEAKKHDFAGYQVGLQETLGRYREALDHLPSLSGAEIEARFAEAEIAWPGALPTAEQDQLPDVVTGAGQSWTSHDEARTWAKEILLNVPTFAVDGSQIPPSRDFSIPVGAVQVGWFENPHAPGVEYVKDLLFEVLSPDELAEEFEDSAGSDFPDWHVNLRRFQLECRMLADYMESHTHRHAPGARLCFFDGSLVISFAQHMRPNLRRAYVEAVTSVLHASQTSRVPVVGYVDTSFARDLVTMLACLYRLPPAPRLSDAALLRPHMQWGDRSQVYVCARDDKVLSEYGGQARQVCFTYLKTTRDSPPARLEFPRWLAEDKSELERTLNLVRAECIVGNGYPYALETADAVAVIGLQDRERFYATFQQFAEKEGLVLRYSRKALSKRTRR